MIVVALKQNVGDFRRDHDFHRRIADHDARHAGGYAARGRVDALAALDHVGKIVVVDLLILRRQRRLLPEIWGELWRLALVVAKPAGTAGEEPTACASPGAPPLALEAWIFAFIVGGGAANHHHERRRKRGRTNRAETHGVLPVQVPLAACDRGYIRGPVEWKGRGSRNSTS